MSGYISIKLGLVLGSSENKKKKKMKFFGCSTKYLNILLRFLDLVTFVGTFTFFFKPPEYIKVLKDILMLLVLTLSPYFYLYNVTLFYFRSLSGGFVLKNCFPSCIKLLLIYVYDELNTTSIQGYLSNIYFL